MTPATDTILAIDLGRYKSVACIYDRHSREHHFRTFDTTPAELTKHLARHPNALVVIEVCGNAGWVHDHAVAAGHTVKVANTTAESWKFQHLKRKTDHDDATRLAELEAVGQLPTVALPDPASRHRLMLNTTRQELVGQRVRCQNRIRRIKIPRRRASSRPRPTRRPPRTAIAPTPGPPRTAQGTPTTPRRHDHLKSSV